MVSVGWVAPPSGFLMLFEALPCVRVGVPDSWRGPRRQIADTCRMPRGIYPRRKELTYDDDGLPVYAEPTQEELSAVDQLYDAPKETPGEVVVDVPGLLNVLADQSADRLLLCFPRRRSLDAQIARVLRPGGSVEVIARPAGLPERITRASHGTLVARPTVFSRTAKKVPKGHPLHHGE